MSLRGRFPPHPTLSHNGERGPELGGEPRCRQSTTPRSFVRNRMVRKRRWRSAPGFLFATAEGNSIVT